MKIIGCDFHPGYQQIAVLDLATGETEEKALSQSSRAVHGVNGLAMNGLANAARPPLTPLPARKTLSVS